MPPLLKVVTAAAVLTGALVLATATSATSATVPTCRGHVASLVGTRGDDRLAGTPGRDVIVGLGGDDLIKGHGGNDLICGDDGADTLAGGSGADHLDSGIGHHSVERGGRGDDRLEASSLGSRFLGGAGDDVMVSRSPRVVRFYSEPGNDRMVTRRPTRVSLDLSDSPVGVHLDAAAGTLTGRGHVRLAFATGSRLDVFGTPYDDVLKGGARGDALRGLAGDDLIVGRGGGDAIGGDEGHNVLRGGRSSDFLSEYAFSGLGHNVAHGGPGPDYMTFHGDDDVFAGPGEDRLRIFFRPGATGVVDGGPGVNWIFAAIHPQASGDSWSHVVIDLARGLVDADGHISRFTGTFHHLDVVTTTIPNAERWELDGTAGADSLIAFDYHDPRATVLRGRAGDDVLVSGRADDTLYGGRGTDQGHAGAGTDSCVSVEGPVPPHQTTGCEVSAP